MWPIVFASVIGTLHLEGQPAPGGGDYLVVPFTVPAGTVELSIARTTGPDGAILDFGVWAPEGWRGWGGGLTEPTTIGVEDSSRGYQPGPITPGAWQLVVGKAKLDGAPASFTADLTFLDAPTLTPRERAPFAQPVLETGRRWYAGDLHVHSSESGDASASFEQIVALAREQQLDFVVLSDHNTVSQHALLAALQPSLPDLLLVRGAEVTTYGGHGNALGVGSYIDHRIGLDGRTAAALVADVNAAGGLFVINHPKFELGTACIGCAWTHADTPWDEVGALEIQTGNYGLSAIFLQATLDLWDARLADGARLAPVGGSDDHRAGEDTGPRASRIGSPTTRVLADELSEAGLLAAIRAGRTEVALRGPTDPLVELTALDGNERHPIGDTVAAHRLSLEAHVAGGNGTTLALVLDGQDTQRFLVDADDWTRRVSLPVPEAGLRVRAHLLEGGADPLVITGHLYATWAPDEGGCAMGRGRPGAGALLVAALVALAVVLGRRARLSAR